MLRNMLTSLIKHERIQTTLPKAKQLRKCAERYVSKAKRAEFEDSTHDKIKIAGFVREKQMSFKLMREIAPRYKHRPGGYTRILRTKRRFGDNAQMCFIEFIDRDGELRTPTQCTEAYWEEYQRKHQAYLAEQEHI